MIAAITAHADVTCGDQIADVNVWGSSRNGVKRLSTFDLLFANVFFLNNYISKHLHNLIFDLLQRSIDCELLNPEIIVDVDLFIL